MVEMFLNDLNTYMEENDAGNNICPCYFCKQNAVQYVWTPRPAGEGRCFESAAKFPFIRHFIIRTVLVACTHTVYGKQTTTRAHKNRFTVHHLCLKCCCRYCVYASDPPF